MAVSHKLAEAYTEFTARMKPLNAAMSKARKAVQRATVKMQQYMDKFAEGTRRASMHARRGLLALGATIAATATLAMKQAEAEDRLSASLDKVGKNALGAMKDMKAFASEIQKLTVFGDELVLETMAGMVNMAGFVGEELKKATKAAIGLSEAYGIDLKAAALLVARAAKGQTQTLARYGIVLDVTGTKQEQFNQLLEIGADKFSLAEARAKTAMGQLIQLKNAIGDLGEAIGRVFLGMDKGGKVLENLRKKTEKATTRIDAMTSAEKLLAGELVKWTIVVGLGTIALSAMARAIQLISIRMAAWATAIGVVLDLLLKLREAQLGEKVAREAMEKKPAFPWFTKMNETELKDRIKQRQEFVKQSREKEIRLEAKLKDDLETVRKIPEVFRGKAIQDLDFAGQEKALKSQRLTTRNHGLAIVAARQQLKVGQQQRNVIQQQEKVAREGFRAEAAARTRATLKIPPSIGRN